MKGIVIFQFRTDKRTRTTGGSACGATGNVMTAIFVSIILFLCGSRCIHLLPQSPVDDRRKSRVATGATIGSALAEVPWATVNISRAGFASIILLMLMFSFTPLIATSNSAADDEKLETLQNLYMQYNSSLMTGDFKNAYDMLSSFTRTNVRYDTFVQANRELKKIINLKASLLSNLKMKGDYGAAKTVTFIDFLAFGKDKQIMPGKIESQVYFIKEKKGWKIATGDDANIKQFLKTHPAAAKLILHNKTRVYYKQGGYWITFEYKVKKEDQLKISL